VADGGAVRDQNVIIGVHKPWKFPPDRAETKAGGDKLRPYKCQPGALATCATSVC
jgi:hypothetical protein